MEPVKFIESYQTAAIGSECTEIIRAGHNHVITVLTSVETEYSSFNCCCD